MGKKVIALTHRYIAAISRAEAYGVLRYFYHPLLCCGVIGVSCLSFHMSKYICLSLLVCRYSLKFLISITFPLFLMEFTFRPHFFFCNGCFRRLILLQGFSLRDQGILNTTYFSLVLMIVRSALVQLGERVYFGKKPTSFAVVLFCFNPPSPTPSHLPPTIATHSLTL